MHYLKSLQFLQGFQTDVMFIPGFIRIFRSENFKLTYALGKSVFWEEVNYH